MKKILLCCLFTQALAFAGINEVFSDSFNKHYTQGRCGDNITGFLKAVKRATGSVEGLSLVKIVNKGLSVFGMVNAEQARSAFQNHDVNWYHHIIAIDENGFVYDFDYRKTPSPRTFSNYVEDMFLDEPECKNPRGGEFCGGRESKLSGYELEFFSAEKILKNQDTPDWSGTLEEALKAWR